MPDGTTMPRLAKRRGRKVALQAHAGDFGPRIRRDRGDVVVEDAADPDAPNRTVRRAKAQPPYARLYDAGTLNADQRNACDRYAFTSEVEAGAKWINAERLAIRTPPWQQGHPTLTQIQASATLRSAHHAVGPSAAALLRLFIRDGLPVSEIARRTQTLEAVAKGQIIAAIVRLEEHWSGSR